MCMACLCGLTAESYLGGVRIGALRCQRYACALEAQRRRASADCDRSCQ